MHGGECSQHVSLVAEVAFGEKTICFLGSLSMLLNNILGPGIANFPALYQQAGWLPPTVVVAICAASSLAGGELLVMAMRSLPGNDHFQRRVEYSTLCGHYFGRASAKFCIAMFLLSMLAVNISTIIQTAQVFDATIDSLFSDSCAVEFYPSPLRVFCHTSPSDITPFGNGKVLLSLGAIIVALSSIPLGYYNLDDNIAVQKVAMLLIAFSILAWLAIFWQLGLEPSRVPALRLATADGDVSSLHGLGGTVLFNFMFISTLPSWVCEKHPGVEARRVVFWSLLISALIFVVVGTCGGMAFREYYTTDNTLLSQLHHIRQPSALKVLASTAVDVYAVSANLASIPIFAIMLRYNLVEQKLLSPGLAAFVAVVVPWLVGVLFYCGRGFADVVEFAGTFTSSIVNLIVPSLLFIASQRDHLRRTGGAAPAAAGGAAALVAEAEGADGLPSARALATLPTDCSGRIKTAEERRRWLIIAWVNASVMATMTLVCMADQVLN
eukprot:TRINITY_DN21878_c0_g1_i1.p1 TRINITY_DN21878_c0_g1~~TRINITY_DN21878_c0_g1_i1.p1  ORF type:complete len:496 (-),score=121.69 TRINITY_DN21878_c0_g1_i1:155-1642(-)